MARGDLPPSAAETDRPAQTDEALDAARRGLLLSHVAAREPARLAIVSPRGDRTRAQLEARANQLVRALRTRGLREGDAVALLCGNRPEFAEVWAACLRGGFRLTPVNWHLTGDEVAYVVTDCEAAAFFVDATLASVAVDAVAALPAVRARVALGGRMEGFETYEAALATEPPDALDDPSLGCVMLYTSGTTGRPKGVQRATSPADQVAAAASNGYFGQPAVNLCTGPLYHAAPLTLSLGVPLLAGATVVLMERWDPEETLALIERHRVTHVHLVPTMFHRLLALPKEVRARYDLSSLLVVVHGAAPCPVPVKRALIEWLGPVVYEYYAATEGAGTVIDSNTWLAHPGTVGKPNPPDQVIVGDAEGRSLPAGEVGIVWLKASAPKYRFSYFKDDDKTDATYRGDHYTLGDLGYLDDDGYLFLTDRSANLIISGGVNVYPAEVDAVLLTHPAVGDAATIGVPDEEWGERVLAVVELAPGVVPSRELAEELLVFCRGRLARFKCPRAVDFVEHLPREDNGKIYKRRLRDEYRSRSRGATGAPE